MRFNPLHMQLPALVTADGIALGEPDPGQGSSGMGIGPCFIGGQEDDLDTAGIDL